MKAPFQSVAFAACWLLLLVCFIGLAIRAATGGVLAIDVSIAEAVQDLPGVAGDLFALENWLGDTAPLIVVTLLLALALSCRGSWEGATLVILSLLPRAGGVIVKELVSEPRPASSLIRVNYPHDNLGFPSGHVIGVMLVFMLVLVFAPRLSDSRLAVALLRCVSLLLISTIGLARIWAGAHWPTDVLGGYLYALLFLIPALAWFHFRASGRAAVSQAPSLGCPGQK